MEKLPTFLQITILKNKAMKKKATKYDRREDHRKNWKNECENEIMTMQEEMDELADELGLSEETILRLEKIVDKFKGELNKAVDLFEVTPQIALQNDCDFLETMLDEVYYERLPLSEPERERMIDITCDGKGGQFIKINSLTEQIKLDEFLNELAENPYQLKLIA